MSLSVYTHVVCRNLVETVSKQVHFFLVDIICDGFVPWMMEKGTPSNLRVWLAEDAKSEKTRVETERALAQFTEALLILETAGVAKSL